MTWTKPKAIPAPSKKQLARFSASVHHEPMSGCWLWAGYCNPGGYGMMSLGRGANYLAHRVAYFIEHGKQPSAILRHTCDNPCCVNPDHLVEGDQQENAADMVRRGRQSKGEHRHTNQLKAADVVDIYYKHFKWGERASTLAKYYPTSAGNIGQILRGYSWKYLTKYLNV